MSFNQKMFELGNKGSAIRELFEFGKKQKAMVGEENVFDYSLGNPSIPSPKIVNDTMVELLENKSSIELHGYTSAPGDIEVRKAIADDLNQRYFAGVSFDHIYMTCGAAASLTITLHALIVKEEGDEVIALAPFFPEYRVFAEKAGAKFVVVPASPDFQINVDTLNAYITEKTKAIIVNSPNNPSGAVFSEETILALSKLLTEKEKEYGHPIYLISDEPYREIVYDNMDYPFVTRYYNDTIVCYSYSKSLSLPGERIGYIVVSSKAQDDIHVYKAICGAGRALGYVCAPALFQYMIPSCVGKTSDIEAYKENRDTLYNELSRIGYDMVHPDGAFYLFMKSLEEDANAFSEKAKKYNLLLVPSDSFGVKGYVRLAYCVSHAMILRSIPAFEKLYKEYNK